MSDGLRGVVVSHAELAAALVDAVREITGQEEALVAVSNEGCSRALLNDRLEEAVHATPSVVFVDLPGGSCLQAAILYLRTHHDVAVVAGVNIVELDPGDVAAGEESVPCASSTASGWLIHRCSPSPAAHAR